MSKKDRKVIRIALNGAAGRMGQEIRALISEAKDLELAGGIEHSKGWTKVDAKTIDLVIDFSQPEGFREALKWCTKNKIKLVSGTTGLQKKDFSDLQQAAKKIPLLYSGNMSAGIAALSAMLEKLKRLASWDFQIEEAHHNKKKDAPSGTALLLQSKLEDVLERKLPPPNAIRGGGIPGIHTIWAMGPDETITLTHTAFDRRVFAQGAIYAARWLFDKDQPGLYELADLYK